MFGFGKKVRVYVVELNRNNLQKKNLHHFVSKINILILICSQITV